MGYDPTESSVSSNIREFKQYLSLLKQMRLCGRAHAKCVEPTPPWIECRWEPSVTAEARSPHELYEDENLASRYVEVF